MVFATKRSNRNSTQPNSLKSSKVVNTQAGMKGGKLARNSHFMRMQGLLKRKALQDGALSQQLSNPNKDLGSDGTAIAMENQIVAFIDSNSGVRGSVPLMLRDAFPNKPGLVDRSAAKKQTITVQGRLKTSDEAWRKNTTTMMKSIDGSLAVYPLTKEPSCEKPLPEFEFVSKSPKAAD